VGPEPEGVAGGGGAGRGGAGRGGAAEGVAVGPEVSSRRRHKGRRHHGHSHDRQVQHSQCCGAGAASFLRSQSSRCDLSLTWTDF
jgi:hypothetical protein